jgi:hypothetical protein
VTGYDRDTGEIAIGYEPACAATETNIYFGPLALVSSHAWSGEVCSIGTSGSYAGFDPGTGSYFFVVVGTEGADEGPYGRLRLPDGSTPERPPFAGNACGQVQTLADTCN